MSYSELKDHASKIKSLAIEKYVELALAGNDNPGNTADAHVREAEQRYADVDKIFDDWIALPDFSGALGNIEQALPYLATETFVNGDAAKMGSGSNLNMTQIAPTGAFAQGWESGTATNYANFAGLFGPVISNQWLCAYVLRYAISAEQAMFKEAKESVDSIAHAAIDTLEHITDKSPEQFKASLAVVAAVSGIVAVPLTAGGSLAAGYSIAAVGAAKEVAGLFEPKGHPVDKRINGGSPDTVIQSVRDYLNDLNKQIIDAEDDVQKALEDTLTEVQAASTASPGKPASFVLPRPTVADDPSFGDHD
jgi:hypothetical protein